MSQAEQQYEVLTAVAASELASKYLSGHSYSAREFGDGNLNLVFRVTADSGRSLIIKQALPYLRAAGEAWPLTIERARIEVDALREMAALIPGSVPLIFGFDDFRAAMVMEDLSPGTTWRSELISGNATGTLPEDIAGFVAALIQRTASMLHDESTVTSWRERFPYSPLCSVTEQLVFSDPFTQAASNVVLPELAQQVAMMQQDPNVQAAAHSALETFRTSKECLLHGDLHTGSVMSTPWGTRLIDLEFSFYGPIGFDTGLLMANLALARISNGVRGDHAHAARIDSYAHRYWHRLQADLAPIRASHGADVHLALLSRLQGQAQEFMAVEMIRRVVSLARAQDIETLARGLAAEASAQALEGGLAILLASRETGLPEAWRLATTGGRVV